MDLIVVGLNHQTAPIEVRERLAINEPALPHALEELRLRDHHEAAILSTCNRTEIYSASSPDRTAESVIEFLSEYHGLPREGFENHLYTHIADSAALHLHRVACGLDSLVLGEPQILGQVREAFKASAAAGLIGPVLDSLFRSSIASGRRARTETGIGQGGFSVGHAALDLARSIFGSLKDASVLILGAGKMSELTARHLMRDCIKLVMVANRTFEKAAAIAERFGGQAIKYDEFEDRLALADIVICSTASPTPVVRRDTVAHAVRKRRGRPLFIIDTALPRDVEASVGDLDNVFLYDLDDLQEVVSDMARERQAEAEQAEAIAREETLRFLAWRQSLEAVPVLTGIKKKHEEIRLAELQRLRNQLPGLSEEVWTKIETATRSMINRITRDPVDVLKSAASGESDSEIDLLEAAKHLFAISNGSAEAAEIPIDETERARK